MTMRPMMDGDTYGSIVVWKWDRAAMMWRADLEDATMRVRWNKRGRGGHWTAHVEMDRDTRLLHGEHATPTAAQDAAFAHVKLIRASQP